MNCEENERGYWFDLIKTILIEQNVIVKIPDSPTFFYNDKALEVKSQKFDTTFDVESFNDSTRLELANEITQYVKEEDIKSIFLYSVKLIKIADNNGTKYSIMFRSVKRDIDNLIYQYGNPMKDNRLGYTSFIDNHEQMMDDYERALEKGIDDMDHYFIATTCELGIQKEAEILELKERLKKYEPDVEYPTSY